MSSSKTLRKSLYDNASDNHSSYSRFSQVTNRTNATAIPVKATALMKPSELIESPSKRKMSELAVPKVGIVAPADKSSPLKQVKKQSMGQKIGEPTVTHIRKSSGNARVKDQRNSKKNASVSDINTKKSSNKHQIISSQKLKFIHKFDDQTQIRQANNHTTVTAMPNNYDERINNLLSTPKQFNHHNFKVEQRSSTELKQPRIQEVELGFNDNKFSTNAKKNEEPLIIYSMMQTPIQNVYVNNI